MTNKEAINILKLMPKQSEAIKKAIEVLERTQWHTEPPKKNGKYLVWWCDEVDIADYTDNLSEVDKYNFKNRKRAGWYKYDSDCWYYELKDVKAWRPLPKPYKAESEKTEMDELDFIQPKKVVGKLISVDVLDKIRAEIKALSPEPTAFDVVDGNPIKDAIGETLADVLHIIDKYKESEVNNADSN